MNENPDNQQDTKANRRNLWTRAIFMLLMVLALHVTGTVLLIVMIIQFVMKLLIDAPNPRLISFGSSLGCYLQQIVEFLTFATEEKPFPFSDWPHPPA